MRFVQFIDKDRLPAETKPASISRPILLRQRLLCLPSSTDRAACRFKTLRQHSFAWVKKQTNFGVQACSTVPQPP